MIISYCYNQGRPEVILSRQPFSESRFCFASHCEKMVWTVWSSPELQANSNCESSGGGFRFPNKSNGTGGGVDSIWLKVVELFICVSGFIESFLPYWRLEIYPDMDESNNRGKDGSVRGGGRERDAKTAPAEVRQIGRWCWRSVGALSASLSSAGAERVKSSVKGSPIRHPLHPHLLQILRIDTGLGSIDLKGPAGTDRGPSLVWELGTHLLQRSKLRICGGWLTNG